jgi:hypothetical protein
MTSDTPLTPRRSSALRLLVPLLVALLAALVVVSASRGQAEGAEHDSHASPDALTHKGTRADFHDQMRKLWEDHVTWTRLAIVTFADGSPGFDATATRLLDNQTDIGDAIKPFYGDAAGTQLTALLHDHITIAVELLQAAKSGDTPAFDDASERWYANADDIADFLAAANPKFWPQAMMRADMKTHLDQTLAEAGHELGGQYSASVQDYEQIHLHILDMADMLSDGIIKAFPDQFR